MIEVDTVAEEAAEATSELVTEDRVSYKKEDVLAVNREATLDATALKMTDADHPVETEEERGTIIGEDTLHAVAQSGLMNATITKNCQLVAEIIRIHLQDVIHLAHLFADHKGIQAEAEARNELITVSINSEKAIRTNNKQQSLN